MKIAKQLETSKEIEKQRGKKSRVDTTDFQNSKGAAALDPLSLYLRANREPGILWRWDFVR
ncbi:hypothetical protein PanWU01x14_154840 [Parasponia andersonii]|uniref:Uncharacterized protein n=1 Tax=Parasponia andersonii TaxID=3476 RepID=A0A2P5CGJ1_PARAD|nr:hypothetical protein PanWU01x14_154840 [Parasponia andersonii]